MVGGSANGENKNDKSERIFFVAYLYSYIHIKFKTRDKKQ